MGLREINCLKTIEIKNLDQLKNICIQKSKIICFLPSIPVPAIIAVSLDS